MKNEIMEVIVGQTSISIRTKVTGDIISGTGMLPEEKLVHEFYEVIDGKIVLVGVSQSNVE